MLEKSCFWTGSSTVLKYINNENKHLQNVFSNRISEDREVSDPTQWQYIPTSQNPADDISRGLTVQKLLSSKTWLTGPKFLWKAEETWIPCKVKETMEQKTRTFLCETLRSCVYVYGKSSFHLEVSTHWIRTFASVPYAGSCVKKDQCLIFYQIMAQTSQEPKGSSSEQSLR